MRYISGLIALKDLKSWKRVICIISWIGAMQFIVLTLIAMTFVPGGYDFLRHPFSYLSLTTIDGVPNAVARPLSVIAGLGAAVALIPFWLILTTLFAKPLIARVLSVAGSICGLIAAVMLMPVAIYPGDTYSFEHAISTYYFFLFFALAITIYSGAIFFNREYPKVYAWVSVIFSIVIFLFVFGAFRAIAAFMQKVIVYCFCLWTAFQVVKVWKETNAKN